MIFKTTITDINKMAVAIDKISTMTLPNYSGLGIAIEGLTAKQAALVLSTRNLSQAELEEVVRVNNLIEKYGAEQLVKTGLLSANSSLLASEKTVNAEKLKESIMQSALNKEKAEEFIQTQLSIISDGEETASTIILNKALLDEAVKRGILTKEKAAEILSTFGVVTADKLEIGSKKGLVKATKELITDRLKLNKLDVSAIGGVTALITVIYQFSKAIKEVRERAQELGDSFKETSSTIDDYKTKIEELYKVITDKSSSIEDITNARKSLLSIQDELIDKFGTEESVINNVTNAINGQTKALDELAKAKWQETKNDFTHGGFWNDTANFFEEKDNIERMVDEYGEKTISIKWADYADINKLTDEMVAELENIGIDIKVSTDNLQAVRDFDSLTESIEDTKGASLSLSGNAEEIYNKLLALQNLIGNDDSFDKLYDKVGNTADSYKELTEKYKNFYDQYILQEKIFADDSKYADTFKNITDAAEKYNEAFTSGDEEKIKEAADEYASLVSTAMSTAIANGDSDVATYFENMYPTLKSIVDGWNFNIVFDANTGDLQGKVQGILDELKDENGRSLTAEEILGLGESNAQYQALVAIAHTYNMTIEEMIELLKKRNMVSAMDYQGLVGLFGQDNVDKLSPDDLEIAYTIKNVGNMTFEQLQAEIQKIKDSAIENPISLFDQLTKSQESLDKFQSTVKSAYDAYSTLLSGNYSSAELLDSIQAINQAASDMGSKMNWELIGDTDTDIRELGDVIDYISEKYAKSFLSGAGIDADSGFGKMIADMVKESYKAEAEFEGMNAQLDNLQSSYQTLTGILESYNETGYISLDNLQSLLTADENLIAMLEVENGQLAINQEAYENLVAVQLLEFKEKLDNAAAAEIEALAKSKAEEATNKNADASNNAVEKLDAETAALNRNTSAAISNAVTKAEEAGVSEGEIQGILDKYNEIWNAAVNNFDGDFDGFMGGTKAASRAGSSAGDAYVDAFEEELKDLQGLRDRGVISEKEYLDRLRTLYQKYFKDKKKYAEQYAKYERQYLEGMKSLYDSALSGISKLMSSQIDGYNDAKEAAVSSLTEEKEARLAVIDAQKEQLEAEQDLIDEQIKEKQKIIDGIQKEIDAMKEAREERQRQLDLQRAQYEFERMMHQRTQLVYSESNGLTYKNDTSGIADAKEKVDDAKFEIEIAKKEKEIQLIEEEIELFEEQKDAIQDQIDALDKQADSIEKYYSKMISEQEKYFDSLISNMEKQKSKWEELAEIEEIAKAYSAIEQVFGDMGYTVQDILNGNEQAFEDFKSKYISLMNDMNSNASFAEGLSYAAGVAEENLGSFLDKTKETTDGISDLSAKGSELNTLAEGMSDLADSATTASEGTSAIATSMGELETNTKGISDDLTSINGALNEMPEAENINAISDAFTNLGDAIKDVATALGVGEEGTVGGLVGALRELSELSLGEEETGILSQFNNLKTAVEDVTSAISGGGSSGSKGGDASGSSSASMSAGVGGEGGSGSLVGAIEEFKSATDEALGGGGESGEGEGSGSGGTGAIPQFKELKTAVDDVTTAIGSGESEGESSSEGESDNLIGSIVNLGDTTQEEMGESDGDGVIGKFNEFKGVIEEAANQVKSISEGLDEIDGKEVECSITVNVKMNGSIPAFASGTVLGNMQIESATYNAQYGKAFANGTIGLKHDEKNALRSEYGQPELTVYPNGTTELTTSPVMSDLPKGTVIYNEEQTKKIMDNKSNPVGNAHADGTDDSIWTTLADGTKVRPLQPGDKMYDLVQKFDAYFKSIDGNLEKLVPNSYYEHQKQMEDMTNHITNISNISNSNKPSVNIGDINVTCPGVTSQQVAEQLGGVIGKELDKQFSGFHNYVDQQSRIR